MDCRKDKGRPALEEHQKWLRSKGKEGTRLFQFKYQAPLLTADNPDYRMCQAQNMDLRFLDFTNADLRGSNFSGADLSHSIFINADLRNCNFKGARLVGTNFQGANMKGATVNWEVVQTEEFPLACPREGDFIGYKICNPSSSRLVKLYVPADALRSSATGNVCRCSKAKVLEIQDIFDEEMMGPTYSCYSPDFVYEIGEWVYPVLSFDMDRWKEGGNGIHFFMREDDALDYGYEMQATGFGG